MVDLLCNRLFSKSEAATPVQRRVLVSTTSEVRHAVADAVAAGHAVAARDAETFTSPRGDGPASWTTVDLSPMNTVCFDEDRQAFLVEAGARLAAVHQTLYEHWGVVVPSRTGPDTCGPGCLSGRHRPGTAQRLATEYLYAIEVVLVNSFGQTRAIVATREPDDPHHDLWSAHTAVGAERFGLVTKYWFRAPGASGRDARALLPRAPVPLLSALVVVPNGVFDHGQMSALRHNYGRWHRRWRHTNAGLGYRAVFGGLVLPERKGHNEAGAVLVLHADAAMPDAEQVLESDRAALTEGLAEEYRVLPPRVLPWLTQWHPLDLAPADRPDAAVPTAPVVCECEMCLSPAGALRDVGDACTGALVAFDTLQCRAMRRPAATGVPAQDVSGLVRDALSPARSARGRIGAQVQARAAKSAWDPRGIFH